MDADQTIHATKLIVTAAWLCIVAQAEWWWDDNTPGQEVWYVVRETLPHTPSKPDVLTRTGRWLSGVPP